MDRALKLRSYQQKAIDAVDAAWADGILRPAIVMATGLGKTRTFTAIAHAEVERGGKPLILVHRDELAQQTLASVRSFDPDLGVGLVKAEHREVGAQVVVGSVQTLAREKRREELRRVTLVIVDECFPAGTRVGAKAIEQLRVGDLVPSWDEESGNECLAPVAALMRKRPTAMVRVQFDAGPDLVCTPNHPLLTTEGWCPAGELTDDMFLVAFSDDGSDHGRVHRMQEPDDDYREVEAGPVEEDRTRVLQSRMSRCLGEQGFFSTDGSDESPARLGAYDAEQSDGATRVQGEDVGDTPEDRAPAEDSGRQRLGGDGATTNAGSGPGMADGGRCGTGGRTQALSLQAGHRASVDEGERGDRRRIPFLAGAPRLRPSQGRTTSLPRVAGVQVLEPGSDGTFGGVCPDGFVYNIEVESTHTYQVGPGIVVHNCHHAAARSYLDVLEHYGCFRDTRALGVTATMTRSDDRGLGDVWQDVVFKRDVLFGIREGFLVDVRGKVVEVEGLDLATVARSRGDYQDGALGEAMLAAGTAQVIASAYREHAADRQGVLFAPTVASAEAFAQALCAAGVPTETITGATPLEDRALIYKRVRHGDTQVLSNCMVLTEGFDMPQLSCAVIARPTQSQGLYIQMAGRVLRTHPGKHDALLLDVVGASARMSLRSIVDLTETGVLPGDGESLAEAVEREAREHKDYETSVALRLGSLASKDVDLFAQSHAAWLQTAKGVWFVPTREHTYFLWPDGEEGAYKIGKCGVYSASGGQWLMDGLELDLAMSWAEQFAEEEDPMVASRNASWRTKKARPSEAQVGHAARLGIAFDGLSKNELSNAISVHHASKVLDRAVSS